MKSIYALGVMTGTSVDGADLALVEYRGRRRSEEVSEKLVAQASASFPAGLRERLRSAQSGRLQIPRSALLTRDYSRWLGSFCDRALAEWRTNREKVVIAVHGQTVWHEPKSAVSVQLLDAAVVAAATGCTVVAAFRQPDLARGGEGAPLVPLHHWLRASSGGFSRELPFSIHNVGGIANLTYLTKRKDGVVAFDTGPGNALIDLAAEKATNGRMHYDRDGRLTLANLARINWPAVLELGQHPYFVQRPPKSTGRELFNSHFLRKIPGSGSELVANATALTAHTMAKAYVDFILNDGRQLKCVYVAGGWARNPALLRLFSDELHRMSCLETPVRVLPDELAPPQYLEAIAFARLGFEGLQGKPVSLAAITGASEDAIGAGIFPGKNFRRLMSALDFK